MSIVTDFIPETITLRDHTELVLRGIHPADQERIQAFFHHLSAESVFYRILEYRTMITPDEARQLCDMDGQNRVALAAVQPTDSGEAILAVARYSVISPADPATAEAAIVVADAYQRRGLGTLMIQRLRRYAVAHGIRQFIATVHPNNHQILRFIDRGGLRMERQLADGLWEIKIHLDPAG